MGGSTDIVTGREPASWNLPLLDKVMFLEAEWQKQSVPCGFWMHQIQALHLNCVQKERPKLQTRVAQRTGGLGRGWEWGWGRGRAFSLLAGGNSPPAHSQLNAERGCILIPPPVPKGTGGSLSPPPQCLLVHWMQWPLPWGRGERSGWPTAPGKTCLLLSCPSLQAQVESALNLSWAHFPDLT